MTPCLPSTADPILGFLLLPRDERVQFLQNMLMGGKAAPSVCCFKKIDDYAGDTFP